MKIQMSRNITNRDYKDLFIEDKIKKREIY